MIDIYDFPRNMFKCCCRSSSGLGMWSKDVGRGGLVGVSFFTTLVNRLVTGRLIRCRFNRLRSITTKEMAGSSTVRLRRRVGQG